MLKLINTFYNKINKFYNISQNYKILGPILIFLLLGLKSNYAISEDKDQTIARNTVTEELLTAEFAANNHEIEKARKIYQKIALESKDPKVARRATELALEQNNDREALKTIKIWADNDKESAKAQLIASLLISQYESPDNAYDYIKNLLNLNNNETPVYIELFLSHPFDKPKLAAIGKTLEQIQAESIQKRNAKNSNKKDNPYLHLALSYYYEQINNGTDSLDHINKALALNPDLQSGHIHKIRLLNIYQSTDAALAYMDNTVSLFPNNNELRKLYADILYDLEKWAKAKVQYTTLSKQDVYKEDAILQLAYINITNNDIRAAKRLLIQLTNSDDYSNIANYNLGLIEQQLGDTDKALEYFNSIDSGEYLIRSKIRMSSLLTDQKKFDKAKEVIDSAILIAKKSNTDGYLKEIILSEADILYQQGLYQNAMSILDNVKAHYPEDPDLYYSIAILADKLNNVDLFKENMEYLININPNNSSALSALAWHYYKENNLLKANELLQRAYETDDLNSSKIGARYGAVLWKLGQKEKADEVWQKVIELDPHNDYLREMIEKTKQE